MHAGDKMGQMKEQKACKERKINRRGKKRVKEINGMGRKAEKEAKYTLVTPSVERKKQ